MTRLQSTGVLGLIAAPIVLASANSPPYSTPVGLLQEADLDAANCALATRAVRVVAAASVICCLLLGAALAIPGVATLVHAQSFCASPAP